MRLIQYLLIGAIALLQAAVPLLHAHLGADRVSPHAVHLHLDLHASAGQVDHLTASDPAPPDSAAIGVGQEIRRDLPWDASASTCVVQVLCVPTAPRTLPPRPADLAAHLPQLAFFFAPPPQGPPAVTA